MGAAVDAGSVGREAWLREEVCKQAAYLSCLLALGLGSVGAGAASRLGKWGGGRCIPQEVGEVLYMGTRVPECSGWGKRWENGVAVSGVRTSWWKHRAERVKRNMGEAIGLCVPTSCGLVLVPGLATGPSQVLVGPKGSSC